MKNWFEAASLIIAFGKSNSKTMINQKFVNLNNYSVKNNDYKVMMLKRHEKSSFMPARMVFPGGILHQADYSPEWIEHFQNILLGSELNAPQNHIKDVNLEKSKFSNNEINRKLDYFDNSIKIANNLKLNSPSITSHCASSTCFNYLHTSFSKYPMIEEKRNDWTISSDSAFRICSIRETFEESGFFLASTKNQILNIIDKITGVIIKTNNFESDLFHIDDPKIIEEWRSKVHADANQFVKMYQYFNVLPPIWLLLPWANWLTPVSKSASSNNRQTRFDTIFYLIGCGMNDGCNEFPHLTPDLKETSTAEWRTPSDFLNDPSINLAPPQVYELTSLEESKSLEMLMGKAVENTILQSNAERYMPVFRKLKNGKIYILPGDHLYPDEPDNLLVVDNEDWSTENITVDELFKQNNSTLSMNRIIYDDKNTRTVYKNV